MTQGKRLLFIHGLAGSGQGFKAGYLRGLYPDLLAPDFPGDFWQRMGQLEALVGHTTGWTLIGSSLGGLMAALFACQHPDQVDGLILLAPALPYLDQADQPLPPLQVPVVVVHGRQDEVIPLDPTRAVAERLFTDLTFLVVDATHDLNPVMAALDWTGWLGSGR